MGKREGKTEQRRFTSFREVFIKSQKAWWKKGNWFFGFWMWGGRIKGTLGDVAGVRGTGLAEKEFCQLGGVGPSTCIGEEKEGS